MKSPNISTRKGIELLLHAILQDCRIECGTNTTQDLKTILRRVEHEGLSFLTITLGEFASDFEESLENKRIAQTAFRSFDKVRKNGKLGPIPKLFSGMTQQVFDLDGKLLEQPSINCIFCIRQVSRMWKKVLLECKPERTLNAFDGYASLEEEMSMKESALLDTPLYEEFKKLSRLLWGSTLHKMELSNEFRPKHGPGAVAEKLLQNQKYAWQHWHSRLEPYFSASEYCYHNVSGWLAESSSVTFLSPEEEPPVRVISVPKTLKTPRIIAVEPTCMQYAQQSILRDLVRTLENSPLTRESLRYTDQRINARLALEGSEHGKTATLDLSEASDRVYAKVVHDMLDVVPILRDRIFACRSTKAALPSGITIHLRKFASMGSALCFPIESMVFFTICLLAELHRANLRPNVRNIRKCAKHISIYGDDIVVPVSGVPLVSTYLETFGLKVNGRKSFWNGKFRESCGMDAYDGQDITCVYVRRLLPTSKRDVRSIVSSVELCNQLYTKGLRFTSLAVREYLDKLVPGIPDVRDTSSCVGFRVGNYPTVHRYNKKLHRPEVKGYVIVVPREADAIDGHAALMKWFLKTKPSEETYRVGMKWYEAIRNNDPSHYDTSVGSGRLAFKRRWCQA